MRQQIVRFAAAFVSIAAATGAMAQGVNGFISGTVQSDPGVAISDVAIVSPFSLTQFPSAIDSKADVVQYFPELTNPSMRGVLVLRQRQIWRKLEPQSLASSLPPRSRE